MNVDLYLHVREKEGRLYSDEILRRLPSISDGHPLANEWRARSISASRLTRYLSRGSRSFTVLELGCGNGWFSNLLSRAGHRIIGMDRNQHELTQAARVFGTNNKLTFINADIFSAPFLGETFDIILLASVIQYFEDLPVLLETLMCYLKPSGEIHIMDSPLYSDAEIDGAVQRSKDYYTSLGFPEMTDHYFHHRRSDLNKFEPKWAYEPSPRLTRFFQRSDSPFPWIVIKKQNHNEQYGIIAEAFSRTAEKYDTFAEDHPHLTRIRNKVYERIERFVPKGSRLLELNAGTGIDAVELAQRGYHIHATDIAPGMLERLKLKITQQNLADRITVQQVSFTDLNQIKGAPFDAVFSNLGGLNCIPDLSPAISQLPILLRPNGIVVWTLMPPVCLWEMAEIFRGHPRLAFRRFARNGVHSHLEGLHFKVYYFSPKRTLGWFGDDFECLALQGLSVLTPTAESKNFSRQFPRLYRTLSWFDDRVESLPPWRGWGDFFTIVLRYQPRSK